MTDLAKLVVKFEAETAKLTTELEKTRRQLDRFDKKSAASASALKRNLALAAVAAGAALTAMAKRAIDSADAVGKAAEKIGISAEKMSALQYAAEQSEVSAADLNKSMAVLARTATAAQDPASRAAKAFAAVGVTATDATGKIKPLDQLLMEIADGFAAAEDGAGKLAVSQALLGKGGASMIPFLNQGADGIAQFTAEAEKLGIVISGATAKAADEFNDNLERLSAASRGVANAALTELLPTLVELTNQIVYFAKNSGSIQTAAQLFAGGLKIIATAAVITGTLLNGAGRALAGFLVTLGQLAEFDFKAAFGTYRETWSDAIDITETAARDIGMIWTGNVPNMAVEAADKTDKALRKSIIFNPAKAGDEAQKAAQAAADALSGMVADLAASISTFGASEGAVIRYRLAHGDLADEVAKGGAKAREYAEQIVVLTDTLESKKAAADAAAESERKHQAIMDEGRAVTESVQTAAEKYGDTIARLNELRGDGAISQATYDRAVMEAQKTLEAADKEINEFLKRATENVQDTLAQGIFDVLTEGFDNGAREMLRIFKDMLIRMSAEAVAADLAKRIFGGGGVGSGGGIAGWIQTALSGWAMFGGGGVPAVAGSSATGAVTGSVPMPGVGLADSGGMGRAGRAYLIGTGAQPEMFVPQTAGRFFPRQQLDDMVPDVQAARVQVRSGDTIINQSFSVRTDSGERVTRRTEQQIAAAAARGLTTANKRNN